jgi:ribosomal protein L23
MKLVLLPKITEKTMRLAQDNNVYAFITATGSSLANKSSAKQYIKENFKVEPIDIKTATRLGKTKRFGTNRQAYHEKDQKIFFVKLKKGDEIPGFSSTNESKKNK